MRAVVSSSSPAGICEYDVSRRGLVRVTCFKEVDLQILLSSQRLTRALQSKGRHACDVGIVGSTWLEAEVCEMDDELK